MSIASHSGLPSVLVLTTAAITCLSICISPYLRQRYNFFVSIRDSGTRILVTCICVHWLLYNSVLNIPALYMQTDHTNTYEWVIERSYFPVAAQYTTYFYIVTLLTIESLCRVFKKRLCVSASPFKRVNTRLLLQLAIIIFVSSVFVGPLIGTDAGNNGAWADILPPGLSNLLRGLFVIQSIPSVALLGSAIANENKKTYTKTERMTAYLIFSLQVFSFILLRQRLFSILGVVIFAIYTIKTTRKRFYLALASLAMAAAYIFPTALRYTRIPRTNGEPLMLYLQRSWENFSTGLRPDMLLGSLSNDISYNKAGVASLSVVLKHTNSAIEDGLPNLTNIFSWIGPELLRAVPNQIEQYLPSSFRLSAEEIVSTKLGVGIEGWTGNPGVKQELSSGWIVDLLDSPLMNAAAHGGIGALLGCAVLSGVFLTVIWYLCLRLNSYFNASIFLTCSIMATIAIGGSWVGGSLVAIKVSTGYLLLVCITDRLIANMVFRR